MIETASKVCDMLGSGVRQQQVTFNGGHEHHVDSAAEWIAAALYLAGDDACYMTGQHLTIDGGYVMDGSLPGAAYWDA